MRSRSIHRGYSRRLTVTHDVYDELDLLFGVLLPCGEELAGASEEGVVGNLGRGVESQAVEDSDDTLGPVDGVSVHVRLLTHGHVFTHPK